MEFWGIGCVRISFAFIPTAFRVILLENQTPRILLLDQQTNPVRKSRPEMPDQPSLRLKILIKQHLASHWVPTSKFGSDIRWPLTQFQGRGGSCRFVFVAGRFQQCVRWLIGTYFPQRMSKCSFMEGSAKVLPKIQEPPKMLMPDEMIQLQGKMKIKVCLDNRDFIGKNQVKSMVSPKTWNHPMVIAVILGGAVWLKSIFKNRFRDKIIFVPM